MVETEATAPAEPATDAAACVPGYIAKLKGFGAAAEAMTAEVQTQKLPSLNLKDYRFIIQRPGGIPFSIPVKVVFRPGSDEERDIGTFRIRR